MFQKLSKSSSRATCVEKLLLIYYMKCKSHAENYRRGSLLL
jgi:hypothetical protein